MNRDPLNPALWDRNPPPGDARWRWGNRVQLGTLAPIPVVRTAAVVVETPAFGYPRPFAVQVRYSLAGTIFTEALPAGVLIQFRQRRGIDQQGGVVQDILTTIPTGYIVLAESLGITAELLAGSVNTWVEVIAAPLDALDLAAVAGGGAGGYSVANESRVAANVVAVNLLASNAARRQFFIQNNSTSRLALSFGGTPSFAAGAERWSVVLAGGVEAHYESPIDGYTGSVNGIWDVADAAGEALVSEGTA